tara:strand:+ start:999 stop:1286 length:288 start_codon:yes stop_codon:yes gene_type:complete
MVDEIIPLEYIKNIRRLGYESSLTYCKVFNWFREKWGYTSWIEQTGKEYNYKVYAKGVYHKPIKSPSKSTYCKNYEEAQSNLLEELILIVEEIEN